MLFKMKETKICEECSASYLPSSRHQQDLNLCSDCYAKWIAELATMKDKPFATIVQHKSRIGLKPLNKPKVKRKRVK